MTTPENSAQAEQPSLSGLTVLNLGIALTMSLLMSVLITLLSVSGDIDEGLGKTTLVFSIPCNSSGSCHGHLFLLAYHHCRFT